MTITLTETDIAAYRARVVRHNAALKGWIATHAEHIAALCRSETDPDILVGKVNAYLKTNDYPTLALFDL